MLTKIKSKYIIISIFDFLKNKRKLKIIKCNKALLNHLNITKEDFHSYEIMQEFNNKYHMNIDIDLEVKELNMNLKHTGNELLEYFTKLKFRGLEKLHLSSNNITNIDILEKANFQELKELYISGNEISGISVLSRVNWDKIEILDFSHNNIMNIDDLEKTRLKNLKEIYFYDNTIDDTKVFDKIGFENVGYKWVKKNKL